MALEDTAAVSRAQLEETTGALEALVAALAQQDAELELLLQQVCQHSVQAVPGADMASVTLIRANQPETAASTDEQVVRLDQDQYQAGEGPCLQAVATGELVRVAAEQARHQWPTFVRSGDQLGIASYLSAPLVVDEQHQGALNLYGTNGHGYREVDAALLELYTTAVEGALRAESRYLAARQLSRQLSEALESRSVIDQAKGIIMGQRHLSAEHAFDLLVQHSQQDNIKVRDLAHRLVRQTSHTET